MRSVYVCVSVSQNRQTDSVSDTESTLTAEAEHVCGYGASEAALARMDGGTCANLNISFVLSQKIQIFENT